MILKSLVKKMKTDSVPILWVELHTDGAPLYATHLHPKLESDKVVGEKVKDLLDYIKEEYDLYDWE